MNWGPSVGARHEWCQGTNGARHVRGTYLVPKGLKENFTSLAAQSSAALLTHLSPDMTGQRSSDHSSSVPRSSSQGDAAGSQFRGWLAGIGRQRVAQLVAVVTAVNVALSLFKAFSQWSLPNYASVIAPWIMAIHHSMQAFVILVLLLNLIPDRFAKLTEKRNESFKFSMQVQSQFYNWFRLVWIAWFFLYTVMAFLAFGLQMSINERLNSPLVATTSIERAQVEAGVPVPTETVETQDGEKNKNRQIQPPQISAKQNFFTYIRSNFELDLTKELAKKKKMANVRVVDKSKKESKPAKSEMELLIDESLVDESMVRKAVAAMEDIQLEGVKDLPESKSLSFLRDFQRIFILQSVLTHFFGNIQTLAFFACYFVLLCQQKPHIVGSDLSALPFLSVIVFLLTLCEVMMVFLGSHYHSLYIFDWTTALFGGVSMAMLYSRLESRKLGAPGWLVAILFAYAVLQGADTLPDVSLPQKIIASLVFTGYLIAKVLFYFYVLWLLQSGLLLFFIYSRVSKADEDERERKRFLAEHVKCF